MSSIQNDWDYFFNLLVKCKYITLKNIVQLFLACAYADGCFTPEQAVLTAYCRGYACLRAKNKLIKGLMAAVGLSKEKLMEILPEGIYVACQNSSSSVTVSGPEDDVKYFVQVLQAKGIFAKIVKTGNIAFHSKYILESSEYFLEFLENVIKKPKLRSSKWISTSVAPEDASKDWTLYNGIEYIYNNFSGSVLFDQIYEHIPENALLIEVAPHGLMQGILRRALPETVQTVSLLQRNNVNSEQFLLSTIGR